MLKGTLDDFTLPEVFKLFSWAGKTGRLDVVRSAGRGRVYFRDGDVYYAESSLSKEPLGRKLIRSGALTESELRRALDENAATGRRIGEILVEQGIVAAGQIEAAVREQIEEAAFDLLRWELGEFAWEPHVEADADVPISVSVENLIMEASRRIDEFAMLTRRIPSEDTVLAMATRPPEGAVEISITPDEWRALVLVNGARSVREIGEAVGYDTFTAMRTLYGLVSAGLVEVVSDDAPEAQPHEGVPSGEAPQAAAEEAGPSDDAQAIARAVVEALSDSPGVAEPPAAEPPAAEPPAAEDNLEVVLDDLPVEAPGTESALDGLEVAGLDVTGLEELAAAAFEADQDPDEPAAPPAPIVDPDPPLDPDPAPLMASDPAPPGVSEPEPPLDPDPAPVMGPDPEPPGVPEPQPAHDPDPVPAMSPPPQPPRPSPAVDRAAAARELAGLFDDEEPRPRPVHRGSAEGDQNGTPVHRVEDDDQVTRGLISRLIDGVKGL